MADLVVPQLGESITEAVIAKWLKRAGDAVADGETVAELETDKVTVQLPSPTSGAMGEGRVQEGATVHVGDVIGTVQEGAAGRKRSPTEPGPVPVPVPAPAPAPAAARGSSSSSSSGNGSSTSVAIDRDALLKLTPSQRVTARESGALPRSPEARGPRPDDQAERLAKVDPRDEIVPMSPL